MKKLANSHGITFELIEWNIVNIIGSYLLSNFLYIKKITKINKALLNSKFTLDISEFVLSKERFKIFYL